MAGKRKNRKKSKFIQNIVILIFITAVAFAIFLAFMSNAGKAVDSASLETVRIEIPAGSSTGQIAEILENEGLIGDAFTFKVKSRISGNDGKYKKGSYQLSKSMTMEAIMAQLIEGTVTTVRFTIPEGFDIAKTSERLSLENLINKEEFLEEIKSGEFSYDFLADAPAGSQRLEGYLYPDTYEIFPDTTERQIIDKMLSRFNELFTEEYYQKTEDSGLTINQVITLASIIEREARVPEDRPIIASVFYNRLAIDMPLQSCATVQYILGEQKEKLTNKDIAIDSPYNTYLNSGLPPGPICSPGIESIKAALYPADTDYIYFLAKGDGSHVFSVTYEDFLKNKAMYIE